MSFGKVRRANSNTDNDETTELIIAAVALITSVLALVISLLQALQQYFASAQGFSSCSEAAIGKWHKFSERRMRWTEFRMEVLFDAPVIFLARPENDKGPLGADDDLEEDQKIIRLDGGNKDLKYTHDPKEFNNERNESHQKVVRTANNEKATWYILLMAVYEMEQESANWHQSVIDGHTGSTGQYHSDGSIPSRSLIFCMQRKRRSWDSMPRDFTKPYTVTTFSHIIEIAAMLGIHWKNFDLKKHGQSHFEAERIIPTYGIKHLCFGIVPTLFNTKDTGYANKVRGLSHLHLATQSDIAQTLAIFGCDTKTVNYFRKTEQQARHSHLFPIPFEMVGMIGESMHIDNTVFRMLPNPTAYFWDSSTFSLTILEEEFAKILNKEKKTEIWIQKSKRVTAMLKHAEERPKLIRSESLMPLVTGTGNHNIINELNGLHNAIVVCDTYLERRDITKIARLVFRAHMQEVLHFLNRKANDTKAEPETSASPTQKAGSKDHITVDSIDSATLDKKHIMLAEYYFYFILPSVVDNVCNHKPTPQTKEESLADTVKEVWCTLVARMIYWLELHDFHRMDIQVDKGDIYQSRASVYIA